MSQIGAYSRGTLNPVKGAEAAWYTMRYLMRNPSYFNPDGIWVFCGPQGSGKTISAIHTARQIAQAYPKARVISNIDFELIEGTRPETFERYEQLHEEDNGIEGLIFVLDEIHVLWNSLESKNIPIAEMAALCQMRKSRRLILGTSQVYGRIAKPIREQLKYVVMCHNYLHVLQHNILCDPSESKEMQGHISPKVLAERWWFHTKELYQSYETLEKVERIQRVPEIKKGLITYGTGNGRLNGAGNGVRGTRGVRDRTFQYPR